MVTAPSSLISPPTHVLMAISRLVAGEFQPALVAGEEDVLGDGEGGACGDASLNDAEPVAEILL